MLSPKTPLKNIPKIAPKYAELLKKLGLETVEDFLFYFPFRYDDFSKTVPISEEYVGQTVTVQGKVMKTKSARIFRRKMTITEIIIEDESGSVLKSAWFNQPFILNSVHERSIVRLSGKIIQQGKWLAMTSPAWENASREATNTGRLVPVYGETKGITSKWIRWQIKPLLKISKQIEDVIPKEIRNRLNLYDLPMALYQIHFPENKENFIRAQKRFAFQEMFLIQLRSLRIKNQWEKNNAVQINFDEKLIKNFVQKLPFKLTDAQRKAYFEILKDLEKPQPMNRLLNGDVGSGKTVVAAIASLQVANRGLQAAIMAPTEVLAKQHFENLCELFGNYDFSIALLTNSYQEIKNFKFQILKSQKRNSLLEKIKNGDANIIIGTHAIIQKDVKFRNLALAIIDEQHRFGVTQRSLLQQETMEIKDGIPNTIPHLLTMTATPIPRTLAIAFSGNLDISILDEMPKSRKPIITKIIPPLERKSVYEFLKKEIRSGRQAFVILPLVEESKAMAEVKAAKEEHQRLSEKVFPEFKLGLLHGRLKFIEKEKVMQDFKNKEIDILVSTSVVEVGIDVPNATAIIIEDADRFGLSQLHQFRGRVGRGEFQSHCFLFSNSTAEKTVERLGAMEKSNNGFEIAQKDLELRGPGQFFGTQQSGIPDISMENLSNVKLIKISRQEAAKVLEKDPDLKKHPALLKNLQKFEEKVHLE